MKYDELVSVWEKLPLANEEVWRITRQWISTISEYMQPPEESHADIGGQWTDEDLSDVKFGHDSSDEESCYYSSDQESGSLYGGFAYNQSYEDPGHVSSDEESDRDLYYHLPLNVNKEDCEYCLL